MASPPSGQDNGLVLSLVTEEHVTGWKPVADLTATHTALVRGIDDLKPAYLRVQQQLSQPATRRLSVDCVHEP